MNRFLKAAAVLLLVTGVIWVAVLWHWDSSRRNVGVADIVVYLALLPLVVFGLLLGLRWAWRGAGPRRDAALAAAAAAAVAAQAARATPAGGADAVTTGIGEAQRHATVCLLAAHLASNAGDTPAAALATIDAGDIRPGLDPELFDVDGQAVMSARVDGLQPDALAEALLPILAGLRAERTDRAAAAVDDTVIRALALLAEPLGNALRSLVPWAASFGVAEGETVRSSPEADEFRSSIRWLLGWPAGWSDFEREAATAWARSQIALHPGIALDRFTLAAPPITTGEDLWLQADALLHTLARERRQDLVLVTACDCQIGEAVVATLEQQRRLFSALHRPKGLMPGEAAAAMLLANPDWPPDPEAATPAARLHRPASLRRDTSIDTAARTTSQCLQDSAAHALATARLEPDAIAAVICDADQHTSRGAEFYGATLGLLPHLDAGEDLGLLGVVSGHTGIVGPLLVVALAAERAQADVAPCLALCLGDAHQRLALVARPGEASTTADPTAFSA